MRVLGYIRVSTDEQRDHGHSLHVQERALESWAALHGHTLVRIVRDEGVSASRPLERREGGAAVLAALRDGEVAGVVVTRLDRLFRDTLDGLTFFNDARASGWAVHSVSELIDSSTPGGRLTLSIQLATAAYERDLAVLRSTEVTHALRRAGRVYGPVPFGLRRTADGALVRDPARWLQRELIVRLRTQDRLSWQAVADSLRQHGIRAPSGRKHWALSTLRGIVDSHGEVEHIDAGADVTDARVSVAVGEGARESLS